MLTSGCYGTAAERRRRRSVNYVMKRMIVLSFSFSCYDAVLRTGLRGPDIKVLGAHQLTTHMLNNLSSMSNLKTWSVCIAPRYSTVGRQKMRVAEIGWD